MELSDWPINEPINERYPIYTRANAGEVFPAPLSPLCYTMMWRHAMKGWRQATLVALGMLPHEISEEYPESALVLNGFLYIGVSTTRVFGERMPGLDAAAVDFTYFGERDDVPAYVPHPDDINPEATGMIEAFVGRVMTATELPELTAAKQEVAQLRADRPDLSALSDQELVDYARGLMPTIERLFEQHLTVTGGSSLGPGIVAQIAEAVGDPSLTMRLVAGLGDVDSAAPTWAMWDLSRQVRNSPELTEAFDAGVDGVMDRLGTSAAAEQFGADFAAFLHEFGSRGPNEWDMRAAVWETDPHIALAAVERMRLQGDDQNPQASHDRLVADREAVTAQITEALAADAEALGTFQAGMNASRVWLEGRERAKTNIIKVVHEQRMAMYELGRRHLDDPTCICLLMEDELDAFVADPTALEDTMRQREDALAQLSALEPPFIVDGAMTDPAGWSRLGERAVVAASAGDALQGVPGCPGVARGRARVILDAADPKGLEPGDVLIAPLTDPAWTPLFISAEAVIVDVGAQVSHAVIVSRELGIPCVVSVTDATRRIADGAMIEVDGTTGTVTVLENP